MLKSENTVVEALKQAHLAVLADLRELGKAARATSEEGISQLRARLDATQTHVTEHFHFEEENGYMEAVRTREPRLEHAVEQLAEEHVHLRESLDELVDEAWQASKLEEPLCARVRAWIERIRQHELRENDLVQDALCLDIGAED